MDERQRILELLGELRLWLDRLDAVGAAIPLETGEARLAGLFSYLDLVGTQVRGAVPMLERALGLCEPSR